MSKKLSVVFAVLVIASMVLTACQQTPQIQTVVVTQEVIREGTPIIQTQIVEVPVTQEPVEEPEQPVTMDGYSTTDIPTLDPQIGEDTVSISYIENLFVHLTNYDLETAEIVPEAATEWTISEDGLTYTFTIRNDIPWVYHNPVTGETTQVTDDDGNPRFVTANDFVYGIRRACDPNTGGYYSGVVAQVVSGCRAALDAEDPSDEEAVTALKEAVGVSAPDDATLVITIDFPASFFLSMTPMWTMAAVPQWAIEEHGENWIEAGNIVTNGRYVLNEWVHGVRRTVLRNPLMPEDMKGTGNIERIITSVVPDTSTGYALWLNNEVEISAIPDAELQAHLQQYGDVTEQIPDLAVFYISFRITKPPFDDPQVRRAFSAAFDRETFVTEVLQGQGLPMTHFAPPGIFGAPPIDEVGLGFDPEFAKAQMEAAGYPNCEGFPQVTLMGYSGQSTLNWIEFAQSQWEEVLGCPAGTVTVEQLPFRELLAATAGTVPDSEVPHMWTLGWGPDYADENNWVGDVLYCENATDSGRVCNEIDELIDQARTEPDPETRVQLYREIEEAFFGPEGEVPFFPIYVRIAYQAVHPWLSKVEALFGGQQWYNWTIDWEAKQAALGQ